MMGHKKNPYLLLWLEGPLQSWGHESKFGRRDTLDFPTKSGVLGLLCCARGAGGEEIDWLAQWADLDMQVVAYTPLDRNLQPSPRLPLLRDFHMVGSGYDDSNPWETLMMPKTSAGKKAVGGGTKMTHRHYLQDMAFAVALEAPIAMAQEALDALANPVWDLFLGRKNCAPTEFINQGLFQTCDLAVEKARELAAAKARGFSFQVLQGAHEGEVFTLNDVPLKFGTRKKYRDRQVTVQREG